MSKLNVCDTCNGEVDASGYTAAPRDARQAQIAAWTREAFGVEQATSLPQRAVRLLEEALEAYQAAGGDPGMARKLVDFVFARPVGALRQELGGVGVCALALAAAAGLSADDEERREVERVLAKPVEHFRQRNAAKNEAGFLAVAGSPPASSERAHRLRLVRRADRPRRRARPRRARSRAAGEHVRAGEGEAVSGPEVRRWRVAEGLSRRDTDVQMASIERDRADDAVTRQWPRIMADLERLGFRRGGPS